MDSDDTVLTWGTFQENYYKKRFEGSSPPMVKTTGHIRFELFKKHFRGFHEDKANSYRNEYGPYILICTTFGFALSPYGVKDTFSERNGYGVSDYKSKRLVGEWAEQMHKVSHFIEMIHEISSQFPEKTIILRSHVAEDKSFYKTTLRNLENVKVINKGEAAPWILGSELVIHNGSTTGLEAYFSDKPVIHYEQSPSEEFDSLILKKIGKSCKTPAEASVAIKEAFNNKTIPNNQEFNSLDISIFDNLVKDEPEKLITILDNLFKANNYLDESINVPLYKIYFYEYLYAFTDFIKKPIRKIFSPVKHRRYLADSISFPGFNREMIQGKLDRFEKITGKRMKYRFIGKRIFLIQQTHNQS